MLGHGALSQLALASSSVGSVAVTITATTGNVTLTGYTPTVSRTDNQSVGAATGHLTVTGYAPTVSQSANGTVTALTGHLTETGYSPTVTRTANQTVAANTGHLSIVGYIPTITQALSSQTITPTTGHLVLTGRTPVVSIQSKTTGGGGYDDVKKKKKYIVKVGDRLLVFSDEKSALAALPPAEVKVKQYPAKRKAPKTTIEPIQEVSNDQPDTSYQLEEIARLSAFYAQQQAYQSLLKQKQYEALINLFEELKRQEDEDDELLLLAA